MLRIFFLLIGSFFLISYLKAQEDIIEHLQRSEPGEGVIIVRQDSRIRKMLGELPSSNEADYDKKVLKSIGYRVQVYAGNNSRQAREEALSMAAKVKEYFPYLPVYTHFSSPRWLCRVGDYKSIEEADVIMRKLKETGVFKEISIIREQINIPL